MTWDDPTSNPLADLAAAIHRAASTTAAAVHHAEDALARAAIERQAPGYLHRLHFVEAPRDLEHPPEARAIASITNYALGR